MSCNHFAASATEEVQQVCVTVQGQSFSDEAVRAAVDEAGYEVVGA